MSEGQPESAELAAQQGWTPLQKFVGVLTQPRSTFRAIRESRRGLMIPGLLIFMTGVLLIVEWQFYSIVANRLWGHDLDDAAPIVIFLGPPAGLGVLFLGYAASVALVSVSPVANSDATKGDMFRALGWSASPLLFVVAIALVRVVINDPNGKTVGQGFDLILQIASYACWLWSVVLALIGIGAAYRVSTLRALGIVGLAIGLVVAIVGVFGALAVFKMWRRGDL